MRMFPTKCEHEHAHERGQGARARRAVVLALIALVLTAGVAMLALCRMGAGAAGGVLRRANDTGSGGTGLLQNKRTSPPAPAARARTLTWRPQCTS